MKAKLFFGFVAVVTVGFVGYSCLSKRDPFASPLATTGAPVRKLVETEKPASSPAAALPDDTPAAPAIGLPQFVTLTQQEVAALDYIVATRRRELYGLLLARADIQWIDGSTVTIATELDETQRQRFRDAARYDIISLLGADRSEVLLSSTAKGKSIRDDLENYGSNKIVFAMKFDGLGIKNSSRIEVAKSILDPERGRDFGYTVHGRFPISDLESYMPGASARLQ